MWYSIRSTAKTPVCSEHLILDSNRVMKYSTMTSILSINTIIIVEWRKRNLMTNWLKDLHWLSVEGALKYQSSWSSDRVARCIFVHVPFHSTLRLWYNRDLSLLPGPRMWNETPTYLSSNLVWNFLLQLDVLFLCTFVFKPMSNCNWIATKR